MKNTSSDIFARLLQMAGGALKQIGGPMKCGEVLPQGAGVVLLGSAFYLGGASAGANI